MKYLAIFGLMCVLPVASQAAVTYDNEWKAGKAQSFQHTLEAPAGKYRLEIQTSSDAPISVYSGFKGNKSAPLMQLNQQKKGNSGSAEIELRPTKPDHAYGYAPITVKVGSSKHIHSGSYHLQLTPLF